MEELIDSNTTNEEDNLEKEEKIENEERIEKNEKKNKTLLILVKHPWGPKYKEWEEQFNILTPLKPRGDVPHRK